MKIIKTAKYKKLAGARQINNVCNNCKQHFQSKETDFSPRCPHCNSRDNRQTTVLEDHDIKRKRMMSQESSQIKNIKKAFPEEGIYKSDEDIANEFLGMAINNIEVKPSGFSGWIELSFPEAGEHVGGGANEVTDSWIKYDNGKIAFDNWYPPEVSAQLIQAINKKLGEINDSYPTDTPMGFEDDNLVDGIDY